MRRILIAVCLLALIGCFDRSGSTLVGPDLTPTRRAASVAAEATAYGIMVSSEAFAEPVRVGGATFGPRLVDDPGFSLEADVVRARDAANASGVAEFDACSPLVNASDVAGKIALVLRGTCAFSVKVKNAQDAGAIAVIIHDYAPGPVAPLGGADPNVTIPSVRMSTSDGNALIAALPVTARIFLEPKEAPTVTVPEDITVVITVPGSAVVNYAASGTVNGVATTPVCLPRPSGSRFAFGTTLVTCTVSDEALNTASASFNVTVRLPDTESPTVVVPSSPLVVELTGPGTIVHYDVEAADDVGVADLVCTHPSGSAFALGSTMVTCTATDAVGNSGAESFTVTIIDTTDPHLVVPSSVVADATSPGGATVTYAVGASDLSGSVSTSCSPVSGANFPVGATTVSCTAIDGSGNDVSATFAVTVNGAAAQTENLGQVVAALELPAGTKNSLQAKLNGALAALASGNLSAACNNLSAMIHHVNAQAGKKISVADAQVLVATAERIRSAAGCAR